MTGIVKTKTYNVNHKKACFKILISEHHNGTYYGGIARDETRVVMDENRDNMLHIKHKKFMGDSEENIYNSCIEWIHNNIGQDYEISLSSLR